MGKRHNTLSDDIFRNCKYVKALEKELEIDSFKKDYNEQYNIMLDVYKTLIIINNIFFADSNKNKKEKTNEIIDTIEKAIYKSIDDDRAKYSTRTLKALIDSNTRLLYNKFNEWYENISYNENYFDTLKYEIEKEMSKLESIDFDKIEKTSIHYEKNKNSNYKIFISKLSNLYPLNKPIIEQFKADFSNNYGIDLTDKQMADISLIYELLACANNGVVNKINGIESSHNIELDDRSTAEEYYTEYLKALHIDIKDIESFKISSTEFLSKCIDTSKKLVNDLSMEEFITNFDYYYFITTLKELENNNLKLSISNDLINKIIKDLKDVYKLVANDENLNEAFIKIQAIIERNKNLFERLS